MNFGTMGKGIDDSSTPAVFVGRNMVSVYGMHGIHRGTRSHSNEYGLPPEKHVVKPYGVAYLVLKSSDTDSETDYQDVKKTLEMLYDEYQGWQDVEVKLVSKPEPNSSTKEVDVDDVNQPGTDDITGTIDASDLFEYDERFEDEVKIILVDLDIKKYEECVDKMTFAEALNGVAKVY